MTLETFQAVKFGGSKGGPGVSAASWGGSGCHGASVAIWGKRGAGRWRTVVAKRASRRRAGRQHRPYSYHRQSFESARQVVDSGPALTNFVEKLHFHVALEEVRYRNFLVTSIKFLVASLHYHRTCFVESQSGTATLSSSLNRNTMNGVTTTTIATVIIIITFS